MKKCVRYLTILLIILSIFATASAEKFDVSQIESLSGYEYDKFDKNWTYSGVYTEEYSDGNVQIGVIAYGDSKDEITYIALFCAVADTSWQSMDTVNEMYLIVGNNLYKYKKALVTDACSFFYFGNIMKSMFDDLLSSQDQVSVKIVGEKYNLIIDLDMDEYDSGLKKASKKIINLNMPDYLQNGFLDFADDYNDAQLISE